MQGIKLALLWKADAMVINKADGDNIKSKLTKTEFQ
jgi:putative protein kinase ArgK-like GTPase of G3E family